jgi:hypothetical protein
MVTQCCREEDELCAGITPRLTHLCLPECLPSWHFNTLPAITTCVERAAEPSPVATHLLSRSIQVAECWPDFTLHNTSHLNSAFPGQRGQGVLHKGRHVGVPGVGQCLYAVQASWLGMALQVSG